LYRKEAFYSRKIGKKNEKIGSLVMFYLIGGYLKGKKQCQFGY